MTPQERQLVTDLFDRLATLEGAPRDAEAERLIADGLARAPHAVYPLVQSVLVQDEALKRAHARIRELEGEAPEENRGFLDNMRDSLFGRDDARRGSVPAVSASKWNSGQAAASFGAPQPAVPPQPEPRGGSFLGTAAAAAAGVIGGSMLLHGIQSLMGGQHGQAFGSPFGGPERQTPWGDDASKSDMARDAGINDISSSGRGSGSGDSQRAGLLDDNQADDDNNDDDFDTADLDDFGGDGTSDA